MTTLQYSLQRSVAPDPQGNPAAGFRVVLTCTAAGAPLADTAIFCYRTDGVAQFFSHICSLSDMAEFAVNTPNQGDNFYRSDTIDVILRSPEAREDFINLVFEDFKILANAAQNSLNLEAAVTGSVVDDTTLGAPAGSIPIPGGSPLSLSVTFDTPYVQAPKIAVSVVPAQFISVAVTTTGFVVRSTAPFEVGTAVDWKLIP